MISDYHFIDLIICFLKGIIGTCEKQPAIEMIRERYFPPSAVKINNDYYYRYTKHNSKETHSF